MEKIKGILIQFTLLFTSLAYAYTSFSQNLIINEVSQGTGSSEYIELLVVGPPTCGAPSCIDIRGWIIDDNNGYYAPGSGTGIAAGAVRLSNDPFWSCIPAGTLIVIYNDASPNPSVGADDLLTTDGNCSMVIPISSTLFERHTTLPNSGSQNYPATGWVSGGSWTNISMNNTNDSFQLIDPSNLTVAVFSVSWGNNTANTNIYFAGAASGNVFSMMNLVDNDPFNQANWVEGFVPADETPGAPNSVGNQAWITAMNYTCNPLLSDTTFTNEICLGDCDGTADFNVSGGVPPYTYLWTPSNLTTASVTGLCPGTHDVTATDDNGCTITSSVVILPGASVTATVVSVSDATCGNNDGSVTLGGSGGVPAYIYSLDGATFQGSPTFSNLAPGNYTGHVYDQNSCEGTVAFTIAAPPPVLGTAATTDISCNGANDGQVIITASAGTPGYTYSLDGGTFGASATFTGLTPGAHTVTIEDAAFCTVVVNFIINEPAPFNYITAASILLCYGDSNGVVSVTIFSGGTPGYMYSLDGGPFVATNSFGDLFAGNYVITIQDANGCTEDVPLTITQNPEIVIAVDNVIDASCGNANGQIEVSATGGQLTLEYSIDGIIYQSSGIFSGLMAGTYTIYVRDFNGCVETVTVTVNDLSGLSGVAAVVDVTCNGGADGQVTITASGSSGYTYSLDGGPFVASNNFTGLTAGAHAVTIQDGLGCTFPISFTVNEPPLITGTAATLDITCFGANDGQVTITAGGGTPGYTYSLDGGAFGATNSFSGLTPGAHNVTIQDANNCTLVVNFTINEPSVVTGTAATIDISCVGANDGQVTITPGGGTPGYTYSLDGGAFGATNSFSGLIPGAHNVTIQDANNCTLVVNFTINEPPVITGTAATIDITCFGANDGQVTITAGGGTPGYTYALDGGAFAASNGFSGLTPGAHNVTIQDANNCTLAVNFTINEPPVITGSAATIDITCFGASDGQVTISAGGGAPGFTYALDGGTFGASNNFSGLTPGAHNVTIQDANNCTLVVNFTINEPAVITGTAATIDITCFGANNGEVNITAGGGTAGYTYSLDGGTFGATNNFTGLTPGAHAVTIQDANSCTLLVNFTINEPAQLLLTEVSVTDASCGSSNGQIEVIGSGGTSGYTYSLDGVSYQGSPIFSGLFSGVYTVYVQDANNCVVTLSVTVNDLSGLSGAAAVIDVSCFGGADGQATITPSGGSPGYTYALDGGAFGPANSFTGLTVGSHTVTIQDAAGCSFPINFLVNEPPVITGTAATVDVACFGGNDGQVTITAGGGTPGYSYALDGGIFVAANNFTGLTPGAHIVTIQDANNCTFDVNFTINEPTAVSGAAATVDATCFGVADGEVTATASGGTTPYTYALNGGTFGGSNNFTGLAQGAHTVTVQDANNCTIDVNFTINEPPVLTGTTATIDITCFGANDGQVTITPAGGTSPYLYSLDGGGFGPSNNFTGLTPGAHTITVEDVNICNVDVNFTINEPTALAGTAAIIDITCFGANDGEATISATGGTTPYTFSLDAGPFGATNTFTGLTTGAHTIAIQDGNGCAASVPIVLSDPPAISYTAAITDLTCAGAGNGAMTLTGAGGTGSLTYDIGVANNSTGVFTGLDAGAYNITITDANGCQFTGTENLVEPSAVTMVFSAFDETCAGICDGNAIVIPSGGVGPYSFAWTGTPAGNTAQASNLCPGAFTLTVTDANGCFIDTNFTINGPTALVVTLSAVDASCGLSNGSVNIDNINGGTGTTTIQWDAAAGNATTTNVNNLPSGNYCATVTDANGCSTTECITINNLPGFTSSIVSTSDVTCFGACDGAAEVSAAGGVSPYSFAWNAAAGNQTTALATALCDGSYWCVITDATGCMDSIQVTIAQPSEVLITVSADTTICPGSNATLVAVASGGQGPYTYFWDNVAGTSTNAVSPAGTTVYNVYAIDANGCQSATVSVTVDLVPPLTIQAFGATAICEGETAILSAQAAGGTGNYTYSWNNGGGVGSSITVNPSLTTVYTVTVDDGCSAPVSADVVVTVNAVPNATFTASSLSGCAPLTVTLINTTDPLLTGPNCTWILPNGATMSSCDSITLTYTDPGSYQVSLVVTSPSGCVSTSVNTVTIDVFGNPIADFSFDPNPATLTDPIVNFTDLSTDAALWDWDFGVLGSSGEVNPSIFAPTDTSMSYPVCLTVTNINGCTDTYCDSITVVEDFSLYVPNAFTPDGDGFNDYFFPVMRNASEEDYELLIFNRWGELIFQSTALGEAWDGTYNGLNVQQEVYVWKLSAKNKFTDERHSKIGHVTVLR